ncbi:MAG: PIN domain-containing protein [bacterium]|nr:PIN domain-containing protein [bacterium]
MSARVFVDANVLVCTRDASDPQKQERARAWMAHLWSTRTGRISFQVLQEYYVAVTSELKPGLSREAARSDVRSLLAWRPISIDARVIEGSWLLQEHYDLSWWDALIVSAAQVADCRYLLTEDLPQGKKLGRVQVISPFAISPVTLSPDPPYAPPAPPTPPPFLAS